jgi:DNA repair protein RecO
MTQHRDTGIVLSRKDSGEADNICNIYTKCKGKERFVFKGLKKSGKRPRTGSEPGTILDIIYYSDRHGIINTISEFDILANNSVIRGSSNRIYTLFYMLELVEQTTGHADSNTGIYNLLSAGIDTLATTLHVKHFTVFFTIRYLLLQGIFPEALKCSSCGETAQEKLKIDFSEFRVSCTGCMDSVTSSVGGKYIEFIRQCLTLKLNRIDCERYPDRDIHYLLLKLIDYIQRYYNIKIRSESMLNIS